MQDIHVTDSEWYVLDCLWQQSPQTAMELVEALSRRVGWAKSTTLTTLRRMEAKGLLAGETVGRSRRYTPLVDRETATVRETSGFLDRVYRGSVGQMVSTMARRQGLTEEDLAELRAILAQAEGGGQDA
ncbi:BlaI/MecI/CopY family transcriptional regulator [Dysosmobacter sp.]|uniref:BlaI/MecI/CopY family transcriptional regulator n=1 Tax=Dysosmobacter sp. TaxID=2591382 RepID=UPI003A94FDDA